MRRVIILIIVLTITISPLAFFSVPLSSSAYLSASDFFKATGSSSNVEFSPVYDGIYLIQTTYKSYYSPDTMNSPVRLDNSYFNSGTWNGQDVSELDSKYLYDLEVAGFSQSVSYTAERDYFVYSLVTCLPVKGGDSFRIIFSKNTTNVRECSFFSLYSYIPGGSGCRMVHNEEGTEHPENPLTYTVKSKNQHIVSVLNPDTFSSSSSSGFGKSVSAFCKSFDGLTAICYNAVSTDFFTTSYGYTGDVSLVLKDNVKNYAFSVYEIFTDGTVTPGFNTEGEQVTTAPAETTPSGSGGSSTDLSGVLAYLKDILSAVRDKSVEVTVNVSEAVHQKLEAILDALINLPANMWDCFKIGLADMFGIEDTPKLEPDTPPPEIIETEPDGEPTTTTNSFSMTVDQESFDEFIEEIDIDNLSTGIGGFHGAISFFWYITDKFFDTMGMYTAVYIVLLLSLFVWLLRS